MTGAKLLACLKSDFNGLFFVPGSFQAAWQEVGIKSSQIFPKFAPKVTTVVLRKM